MTNTPNADHIICAAMHSSGQLLVCLSDVMVATRQTTPADKSSALVPMDFIEIHREPCAKLVGHGFDQNSVFDHVSNRQSIALLFRGFKAHGSKVDGQADTASRAGDQGSVTVPCVKHGIHEIQEFGDLRRMGAGSLREQRLLHLNGDNHEGFGAESCR